MRLAVVLVALVFGAAGTAGSQLPPNDNWRTIHTQHFRVHFTPPLEDEARRAAVNAERAYSQLSAELGPPRGTIDLVVSDNVDYVNGYATPFPSNRIVVYAHPPT
ncbi:MAG: peptidase S9, partial [Gemmatimonadaceae bacterium]